MGYWVMGRSEASPRGGLAGAARANSALGATVLGLTTRSFLSK